MDNTVSYLRVPSCHIFRDKILPTTNSNSAIRLFCDVLNLAKTASIPEFRNVLLVTKNSRLFRAVLTNNNIPVYDVFDTNYIFALNEYYPARYPVIFVHNVSLKDLERSSRTAFWSSVADHLPIAIERKSRAATVRILIHCKIIYFYRKNV